MYHARFSGTHYEAGLRWGRALALRGKFIARQPTFAVSEERRAFARGCLPAYREYFPEILEEIRGIAEGQGGIVSITVAAVIFTGILGNLCAPALARLFRVKDPVAAGLAIGACSHAMGTARALELGETEGAMSGLAIGLCGIATTILALFFGVLV